MIPSPAAFVLALVTPQALGWLLIGCLACIGVAIFAVLRMARAKLGGSAGRLVELPDDAMRTRYRKRIRRLKFGVAFFAFVLVYGLWETRDAPWPPRIVGTTMNLLFQTLMIQSIRRMQKQLKQGATDQSQ